jgi:hypothetical protein
LRSYPFEVDHVLGRTNELPTGKTFQEDARVVEQSLHLVRRKFYSRCNELDEGELQEGEAVTRYQRLPKNSTPS